jgi:hypothetical protein
MELTRDAAEFRAAQPESAPVEGEVAR